MNAIKKIDLMCLLNLHFDDFAAKFIYLPQPTPSVFAEFALTNVNCHALLRFNYFEKR